MTSAAGTIKAKFLRFLEALTSADVSKNPERDFSRNRIFSISKTILSLILLGKDCLNTELRRLFHTRKGNEPTKSAFIQQRAKLSEGAMSYVFNAFNSLFPFKQTLNGVHILAADGSDNNVPPDGKDSPSYISYGSRKGGYFQDHLNTVYDVLEKRFVDIFIQPRGKINEATALTEMVLRNPIQGKCLYIMDRGYNCFELMASIQEAMNYFMIRAKEVGNGSLVDCFTLPEKDEYDIDLNFYIAKSRKSKYSKQPGFKALWGKKQHFRYLKGSDPAETYILPFRLVKIKLCDNSYEYLITNLPREKFELSMMKHLYHLRWDTEEAYFMLKYKANLVYHHSRKKEFIIQETYARLILYNLTSLLTSCVSVPSKDTKYEYKIDRTQAFITTRLFFSEELTETETENALLRYRTPIRPDRRYTRKVRSQSLKPLNNRN